MNSTLTFHVQVQTSKSQKSISLMCRLSHFVVEAVPGCKQGFERATASINHRPRVAGGKCFSLSIHPKCSMINIDSCHVSIPFVTEAPLFRSFKSTNWRDCNGFCSSTHLSAGNNSMAEHKKNFPSVIGNVQCRAKGIIYRLESNVSREYPEIFLAPKL